VYDKQLNKLIAKYLRGECTSAELDTLFGFIRENPTDGRIQELMRLHWETSAPEMPEEKLEIAYDKVNQTMEKIWQQTEQEKPTVLPSRIKLLLVAASIIGILFTGVALWKYKSSLTYEQPTASYLSTQPNKIILPTGASISLEESTGEPKILFENENLRIVQIHTDEIQLHNKTVSDLEGRWMELAVAKGKKMKVELADGSMIWLNADSRLRFPDQFGKSKRRVDLTGEGYFEISHSKEKPFFVMGTGQLVQVYGTRFNVRNYTGEEKSSVTLFEGKLSVRKKYNDRYLDEKMLSPKDHVDLPKSSEAIEMKTIADETKSVEWMADRKYYENALLKDIFMDLSHQYEIDIDWENIPTLKFQGYLPKGSDLDETLQILSRTANIRIKRNKNLITFN
jgi:hypothetical protein